MLGPFGEAADVARGRIAFTLVGRVFSQLLNAFCSLMIEGEIIIFSPSSESLLTSEQPFQLLISFLFDCILLESFQKQVLEPSVSRSQAYLLRLSPDDLLGLYFLATAFPGDLYLYKYGVISATEDG